MKDIVDVDINAYYDQEIVRHIVEKYDLDPMDALAAYLDSETYKMFTNPELKMVDFAPFAIFDMWECEQITGDPRSSIYIRGE